VSPPPNGSNRTDGTGPDRDEATDVMVRLEDQVPDPCPHPLWVLGDRIALAYAQFGVV